MHCLKFKLSGQAACFRRPDVNERVYFTYNNIHKVALLGLLGAVIGLKGYGEENREYPEFYETLSDMLVSVVPNGREGYFTKKIQYFNNSVGYASKEAGGNLQVREQWLENPDWTVFLMQNNLSTSVWDKLCDYLLHNKCIYIPYLGKNDFPARIENVEIAELHPIENEQIHSLFIFDGDLKDLKSEGRKFLFTEIAPIGMVKTINFYEFKRFVYTNCTIPEEYLPIDLYTDGEKNYSFY